MLQRQVWRYGRADWDGIRSYLKDVDWNGPEDSNAAAQTLTTEILNSMTEFIPQKNMSDRKCTHPWLSARGVAAVEAKLKSQGTTEEGVGCLRCSAVLKEEREAWIARTRDQQREMKAGSKQSWRLSGHLAGSEWGGNVYVRHGRHGTGTFQ